MTAPKHTPAPWHAENGTIYSQYATIGSAHGKTRNDAENDANAAFIVRAVNAHDALVEALEEFIGSHATFSVPSIAAKARAALRAAKGES